MKRAFRTLSLLLCCALLLTAVPDVSAFMPAITALAEDEVQQTTAEPQAEAPAATDAPKATQAPEITEVPAETDAPEITEAPAETDAPQETQAPEATATPEATPEVMPLPIDYTLDADKNPAFESGYVQLKSAVTVYEGAAASDDEIARLNGGVAYAVKRSAKEPDRLQIVFNDGSDALAKGWIDADRARPMNPETESPKFAESAAKDEEMLLHEGKYPLLPLECSYVEDEPAGETNAAKAAVAAVQASRPGEMQLSIASAAIGSSMVTTLTIAPAAGKSMQEFKLETDSKDITISQPHVSGMNATATITAGTIKSASAAVVRLLAADGALLDSCELQLLPAPEAKDIIVEKEISVGFGDKTRVLSASCAEGTMCGGFTYMISANDQWYASINGKTGLINASAPTGTQKYVTIYITPDNNSSVHATCRLYVLDAPTSVTASKTKVRVGVGDSLNLVQACTLDYAPQEGYAGILTYKTSNKSIATVSADGVVRGIKKGSATITVGLNNNPKATKKITVQVLAAAKSATVKSSSDRIGAQMSGLISIVFPKDTYGAYTLSAQPEGVLNFDLGSVNTGLANTDIIRYIAQSVDAPVDVTVTVTANNGKWAGSTQIRVLPGPEKISVKQPNLLISYGERNVKVEGVADDADTMCAFSYTSSKPGVLSVNAETGELTVKADTREDVAITVRSLNSDASTVCIVGVVRQPENIGLTQTSARIGKGDTIDLLDGIVTLTPADSHAAYSFKSSNTKIAAVSAAGIVTGKSYGSATITITTHNNRTIKFSVSVSNALTASKMPKLTLLAPADGKIGSGMSGEIKITFPKKYYAQYDLYVNDALVTFDLSKRRSSYNSKQQVVTDTVPFTANDVSEAAVAHIRLVPSNNAALEAALDVQLLPAPSEISARQSQMLIGKGQTGAKVAGVYPEGTACGFKYAVVSGSSIAINETTGEITTREVGRSVVRITASNSGVTAECTVEVKPAPESIAFAGTTLKIGVGDTLDLSQNGYIVCTPADSAGGYTFKTSNKRYVSVTAAGVIKGVKKGSAKITATSHNGKTAVLTVQVNSKPTGVSFAQSDYELGVGMSTRPAVKFTPASGAYSLCSYSVANSEIAAIDQQGAITALQVGSTQIYVTTQNGKKAEATLTVLPGPEQITVQQERVIVGMDQKGAKVVGVYPAGTACDFTYEVVSGDTITIDKATGAITTKAVGQSTVRVRSSNSAAYVDCIVDVRLKPESIAFAGTTLKIGVGDTLDLSQNGYIVCTPADSAAGYTFKTSNKGYVSVTAAGVIKGVKKGSAKITATSHNGKTAVLTVQVNSKPTGVSFAQSDYELGVGMSTRPAVKFTPASGAYSLCSYSVANSEIAAIDQQGAITALQVGSTQIYVTTQNGKKAEATLTVLPGPEQITVQQERVIVGMDQKGAKVVGVYPAGTACDFTYEVVSGDTITIDKATGAITTKAVGQSTVRVRSSNSAAYVDCIVDVRLKPESIAFAGTTLKIGVGDTLDLSQNGYIVCTPADSAAGYTFKTSNKGYVSVTAAGVIKGVKKGSAKITATSHNGKTAVLTVKVCDKPKGVAFAQGSYTLGIGMSARTAVKFTPASSAYSLCSYSIADPEIATVDANGAITAVAAGDTLLTVETTNGKRNTAVVHVLPAPTSVGFKQDSYELSGGMKLDLNTCVEYDDGTMAELSFSIVGGNTASASIDANGVITALAKGSVRVQVTATNGKNSIVSQKNCTIVCSNVPDSISYAVGKIVIAYGDTVQMPEPIARDVAGTVCPASYKYKSSNSKYVKIVNGNYIQGVKAGTATVQATSHNGKTTTIKVEVTKKGITGVRFTRQTANESATLYTNGADYQESTSLYVTVGGTGLSYASLNVQSSNPDAVEVVDYAQLSDQSGTDGIVYKVDIVARSAGEAVITAKNGSKTDSYPVHALLLSSSFSFGLEDDRLELGAGESYALEPAFEPVGSGARLSYTSSNPKVVTVDENGVLKALAAGSARITATGQLSLTAYVDVEVLEAPLSIKLNASGLNLTPGESVVLTPLLTFKGSAKPCKTVRYESDNPAIATAAQDGTITAVAKGEALITATTVNGLTAVCQVHVGAAGTVSEVSFAWSDASIVKGDTALLPLVLNKAAFERGYTITSSDPNAVQVTDDMITALEIAQGVTLTLSVNAEEGEAQSEEQYTCSIDVIESAEVTFSAEAIELMISSKTAPGTVREALVLTVEPANLVGTYSVETVDVEGSGAVEYRREEGYVYATGTEGVAEIICHTFGKDVKCLVTVQIKPVYRALIIAEFNRSGASNDLKFANNNVTTVNNALSRARIDGEGYASIRKMYNNPSKASIQSAITTGFADADEDDVSVIYIVAHGYNKSAQGGYHFGLPKYSASNPSSYVRASELMGWLRQIPGNVVLILDSCHSGGFISQNTGALSSAGNIAVITAQAAGKRGCYYIAKSDVSKSNSSSAISASTVEMMTYALCYGLGVQQLNTSVALQADSNGDNVVTISECFDYTSSYGRWLTNDTKRKVANGSLGGKFYGDAPEDITFYVPAAMRNIPLVGR